MWIPTEGACYPAHEHMAVGSAIYVLQVLVGCEQQFARLAGQRLRTNGIDDAAIHWPRRALQIRRSGRTTETVTPIFPGYLFLEVRARLSAVLDAVLRIPGLMRVLPETSRATPLDSYDLELIRHLLGFGAVIERSRVSLASGCRIVVHDGPLKGMEGRIVKVDARKKRAKVRLDLYGDAFLVDFGIDVLGSDRQRSVA